MSYGRDNRTRIYPNESMTSMYNQQRPVPPTSARRQRERTGVSDETERSTAAQLQEDQRQPYAISSDVENVGKSIRLQQIIIDLIVIIATFLIFILVLVFVDPKLAYFTCAQSDIFYPYKEDTVPFWAVGLYATLGPVIIILAIEFLQQFLGPARRKSVRSIFVDIYSFLSLFALGIAITLLITEIGSDTFFKKFNLDLDITFL